MSKVVVIGAGPAGIIASLRLSENNDVILVEKNDKIAKKILLTGNGRCNYWNSDISLDKYYSDNQELLEKILSYKDLTLDYLYKLGIYPHIKNGYYYPYSNQAYSVRELLNEEINRSNVKCLLNTSVKSVNKKDDKFEVLLEDDVIYCDKVVVATGSKAYPKTGSEGDGYRFASNLGINVTEVFPSLVQLKSSYPFLKEINGIRLDGVVSLYENGIKIKEEKGEVQFTDYGLSGICIFNISGLIARMLNDNKKVQVKINLVPDLNREFFENWFNNSDKTIFKALECILNYKLSSVILKDCHLSLNAYFKSLTDSEKNMLFDHLFNFTFDIIGTNSFDKGQVCTGGISMNELNENLESKKISGLYFIGEVNNVDGICGGFNLAHAFISGFIVGSSIK